MCMSNIGMAGVQTFRCRIIVVTEERASRGNACRELPSNIGGPMEDEEAQAGTGWHRVRDRVEHGLILLTTLINLFR